MNWDKLAWPVSLALFIVTLVAFSVGVLPRRIGSTTANLASLSSIAAESASLPWRSPEWWLNICRSPSETDVSGSADSAIPHCAGDPYCVRSVALAALAQFDCANALDSLVAVTDKAIRTTDQLLTGYAHAALGEWSAAVEALPSGSLEQAAQGYRQYWTNVLFRAGNQLTRSDLDNASKLLNAAERLDQAAYREGSLALFSLLDSKGRSREAMNELRYVLVNPNISELPVEAENYISALRKANLPPLDGMLPIDDLPRTVQHLGSQPTPTVALAYQWDDHWEVIGYTIDQAEVEESPLIPLTLYWRQNMPDGSAHYYADTGLVRNFAADAGFEWSIPLTGTRPFGYSGLYSAHSSFPYGIVQNGSNQAFCLYNDAEISTGVQSQWLTTSESLPMHVLVAGDYRTDADGKAYLGLRWREQAVTSPGLNHIVAGGQSVEWRTAAAVLKVPQEAERIGIHLLQYQTQGTACFDNLLFVPIVGPPSVTPE